MSDLEEFERELSASLHRYMNNNQSTAILPKRRKAQTHTKERASETNAPSTTSLSPKSRQKRWTPSRGKPKHRIILRVFKTPLSPYQLFTFESTKLSKLEARFEADKAAEEEGWQVAFLEEWIEL